MYGYSGTVERSGWKVEIDLPIFLIGAVQSHVWIIHTRAQLFKYEGAQKLLCLFHICVDCEGFISSIRVILAVRN